MAFDDPVPLPPGYEDAPTSSGTQYLGNVAHARVQKGTVKAPFGGTMPVTIKGYKKGDQVKLLPKNGGDLANVQRALWQAGYLSDAQYENLVLGSPDDVTTLAFSKLLATSNMTGQNWREALSQRLAAAAAEAPEGESTETPPLTIALTDPAAIKQTINASARKLLGGYMSDAQVDQFVSQFQAAQTTQQTQAHMQQYNPGVGYGPGGSTTTPDLEAQAEEFAKSSDPNQYKATQFGSQVHSALASLRSTGYLQ